MTRDDLEASAKIRELKERLARSLKARFLVRFHVGLIMAGAIAIGWITDNVLLKIGVDNTTKRYPCAVLTAYFGFIVGARLWIEYSGIREYINVRRARELLEATDNAKVRAPADRSRDWGSWWDTASWVPMDGEGCLVIFGVFFAISAAVFLVYTMGGYLLVDAGGFFSEIVFELLLAAGLVRGMRKIDSPRWTGSLFSATWPALFVSLALSLLIGAWVHQSYPDAKTLPEALEKWKTEKSSSNESRRTGPRH